ncbi:MAG: ATP-binding cassette domain-containing protein [bacterium]
MISINNLYKRFDQKVVVDDLTLTVDSGDRVAIIGPSGCGKSTLLKLITGLVPLDRGRVVLNSQTLTVDDYGDVPSTFLEQLGFLFQSSALFDSMTVKENVAFYHRETLQEQDESLINRVVRDKLAMVDMAGYENEMPSSLSGGQCKRIALARALAKDPKIMLYDEPTTGLDPFLSNNIENLIVDLSDTLKVTSLIITHQHSTIFRTAKKIYYMDDGKLIGPETPESILLSTHPKIREFFSAEVK